MSCGSLEHVWYSAVAIGHLPHARTLKSPKGAQRDTFRDKHIEKKLKITPSDGRTDAENFVPRRQEIPLLTCRLRCKAEFGLSCPCGCMWLHRRSGGGDQVMAQRRSQRFVMAQRGSWSANPLLFSYVALLKHPCTRNSSTGQIPMIWALPLKPHSIFECTK